MKTADTDSDTGNADQAKISFRHSKYSDADAEGISITTTTTVSLTTIEPKENTDPAAEPPAQPESRATSH